MTEEVKSNTFQAMDCLGECHRPGNRGGYWPAMLGNFVIIHEKECDGMVRV